MVRKTQDEGQRSLLLTVPSRQRIMRFGILELGMAADIGAGRWNGGWELEKWEERWGGRRSRGQGRN